MRFVADDGFIRSVFLPILVGRYYFSTYFPSLHFMYGLFCLSGGREHWKSSSLTFCVFLRSEQSSNCFVYVPRITIVCAEA